MFSPWARDFIRIASVDSAVKWVPGGDNLVKGVQCYELFGGIALKNHAFSFSMSNNIRIIPPNFNEKFRDMWISLPISKMFNLRFFYLFATFDFFLCGAMWREWCMLPPPHLLENLEELKLRITTALQTVTQDMQQRVLDELEYRIDVCRVSGGANIEHLWNRLWNPQVSEFFIQIWRNNSLIVH